MEDKILTCLKNISESELNGDCVRIVLFVAGSGKQCRLSEIEEALNLKKTHTCTYCKKLYKMGIFKRYTKTLTTNEMKRVYPCYSINWNYTKTIQN